MSVGHTVDGHTYLLETTPDSVPFVASTVEKYYDGNDDHHVGPGDVVVVEADTDRGVRADPDTRLEALLVTAPPPTDAEHDPVRSGLKNDEFDPTDR